MDAIQEVLAELHARLPELEWTVSTLPSFAAALPRGLFQSQSKPSPGSCLNEIKADIESLSQHKNKSAALYIAARIRQKINVLVSIYHIQSKKKQEDDKKTFILDKISTKKQWIETLENEIASLVSQQAALQKTLEKMKSKPLPQVLSLQKELGEIERRLSLAEESLNKAII